MKVSSNSRRVSISLLALAVLPLLAGCGGKPVEARLGDPVPLGSYTLTARLLEKLPLTEGEQGLAVHLDLRVEDLRAPEQVHGTGFQSLVSDPYHEHRERTLRDGLAILDASGETYRATGYARQDVYRRELGAGDRAEAFWRLAHEEYPKAYWEGESPERWVVLFSVPSESQGYVLRIENRDRREGQPTGVAIPLGI